MYHRGRIINVDGKATLISNPENPEIFFQLKSRNKRSSDNPTLRLSASNYEDLQTIDWLKERTRNWLRNEYLKSLYPTASFKKKLNILFDKICVWLIIILVGVISALTSVFVAVGISFLSDFKEGFCTSNIFLNKESCCWQFVDSSETCIAWKTWAGIFRIDPSSKIGFVIGYLMFIIIAILYNFFSACTVRELAPYACGGGIAEIKTILGGFIMKGFLGFWTYFVKAVSLITTVSSGVMLGQEGPMVHITCCVANLVCRFFPKFRENEANKREIISTGAATGLAIAFGSPIGGVLFSLEEISYYFPFKTLWYAFCMSLVGVFIVTTLNPYLNQTNIIYYVNDADWAILELPFFALIGTFGGFFAALFTRVTMWWNKYKSSVYIKNYPVAEVLVVTFITGLVLYPIPLTRMSNHHLIRKMFTNCVYRNGDFTQCVPTSDYQDIYSGHTSFNVTDQLKSEIKDSLVALFMKSFLMLFTFGIKVPSGLFVPSLAVGSLFGRIIGISVELLAINNSESWFFKYICSSNGGRCIYPGLYAVIGAASVLAGINQMTVCIVVIMVEITGKLNYILPLMFSVMMAKWVSNALLNEGIYDELIIINNYPFWSNKEEVKSKGTALDVISVESELRHLHTLPTNGLLLSKLSQMISENIFSGYPIVTSTNKLYGYVLRSDLLGAIDFLTKEIRKEQISSTIIYFSSDQVSYIGDEIPIPNEVSFEYIVDQSPVCVDESASVYMIAYIMRKLGVKFIIITHKGYVKGIATKKDIISYLHRL